MKNAYSYLKTGSFVILMTFGISLTAQRIVQVPQGVGTLNDAIDGDTTATGDRVDLNTIYELENGGIYKLNRSVENENSKGTFPLHIRTVPGYTTRAFLQPTPGTGGSTDRAFRVRDDLTVEGVRVTNKVDAGGFEDQIFRIYNDNSRVVIDDCEIDEASQSAFRTDGENVRLFISNSYISNIGLPTDIDNGRFIDTRRNDVDTIWLENNQIYNITSRWIRGDFDVNVLYVNQTTFANCAQAGFQIGELKNEMIFTNNIIKNSQIYGRDTGDTEAIIEIDEFSGPSSDLVISHNNVYWTSDLVTIFNGNDTLEPVEFLDSIANANTVMNGLDNTNFVESISYSNAAPVPSGILQDFINGTGTFTAWDRSGWPYDYDYTPTGGPSSYIGGDMGQPVGGLVTQGIGLVENIKKLGLEIYPNPATSILTVNNLNHNKSTIVKISIVSLTGQVVMEQQAGIAVITDVNVSNLPNGVYILKTQLETGEFGTQTFLKN